MSSPSPRFSSPRLPLPLESALLEGCSGEARLLELAERLLQAMGDEQDPALLAVFRDMTLAAWETNPLSAKAARIVSSVHAQSPFLLPNTAAFASTCAALRPHDRNAPQTVLSAVRAGDTEGAKDLTTAHAAREPGNLFWLQFAVHLGILRGELDWYEPWLADPPMPPEFADAFRADYAFARDDYATAAALYAAAFARTGMTGWLVREGECLLRLGDRDAARKQWVDAARRRPWQVSLRYRLRDVERGADIPGDPPPGKGEILVYSWNHGQHLNMTLAALFRSRLGGADLTVLDNGSRDETPGVIAAWKEKFGSRMRTVTLPVNIGAPAARNWLLHLEPTRRADWAVFLDDDALVPPDWLGHFGMALRLHPGTGVLGCRVVDMAAPLSLQSVDLFFEERTAPGPEQGTVTVTHAHGLDPDFGQYSYCAPCCSVTGCCHMLTRANMDAIGPFDLRFSPSQMDDVERDIRSCLGGFFPLYQGHLKIRHLKRSGLGVRASPWQEANCAGNAEKLKRSYAPETLLGLNAALRALPNGSGTTRLS